ACAGKFHIINIKLMKCGGLSPAKRMIQQAKKLGMQVMTGCMTESSVGIAAIAQLLPQLDYVDMDGALLLNNDPAKGVIIENGRIKQPLAAGLGVQLDVV
ncbi:MAG: enolase C-terminal domain-like protein, partial [Bacteroidota bacterium]